MLWGIKRTLENVAAIFAIVVACAINVITVYLSVKVVDTLWKH